MMVIHVGLPHVGCRFDSGNSYESNQIKMGTHITIFEALAVSVLSLFAYVFIKAVYDFYFKTPKK